MPFLLPLLPVLAAASSGAGAMAGGIAAGAAIGAATAGICNKRGEKSESETRHSRLVETAEGVEFECEETRANLERFVRQKKAAMDDELREVDELLSALKRKAA